MDLRSAVSKEGCRTVALLARCGGHYFGQLAELWVPVLLRVVTVKTQVMNSAADRSIRTIISSSPIGFPRLISGAMLDCFNSKNGALRALGLEYICLACAIWKPETIEKQLPLLRQFLKTGMGNADPNARKASRQLYWILKNRPGLNLNSAMNELYNELDVSVQKSLSSEITNSTSELQKLINGPNAILQLGGSGGSSNYNRETLLLLANGVDIVSLKSEDSTTEGRKSRSPTKSKQSSSPGKRYRSADSIRSIPRDDNDRIENDTSIEMISSQRETQSRPRPSSSTVRPPTTTGLGVGLSMEGKILNLQQSLSKNSRDSARVSFSKTVDTGSSTVPSGNAVPPSGMLRMGGARRVSVLPTQQQQPNVASITENNSNSSGSRRGSILLDGPKRIISKTTSKPISQNMTTMTGMNTTFASDRSMDDTVGIAFKRIVESDVSAKDISCSVEEKEDDPMVLRLVENENISLDVSSQIPVILEPTKQERAPVEDEEDNILEMNGITSKSSVIEELEVGDEILENVLCDAALHLTLEDLKKLSQEPVWSERLRLLDMILLRVNHIRKETEVLGADDSLFLETSIDLVLNHLGDIHLKVALRAIETLTTIIETYPICVKSKLSRTLVEVFVVLSDRRQKIREAANKLLNLSRAAFDPITIASAMFPKLSEISNRSRAALLQYLAVITPYCEEYLLHPQNMRGVLNRLALIFSDTTGHSSSSSTIAAANRLLELIFKVSPQMVLSQVEQLSLPHQLLIKRHLEEGSGGTLLGGKDIDLLISNALQDSSGSTTSYRSAPLVISRNEKQSPASPPTIDFSSQKQSTYDLTSSPENDGYVKSKYTVRHVRFDEDKGCNSEATPTSTKYTLDTQIKGSPMAQDTKVESESVFLSPNTHTLSNRMETSPAKIHPQGHNEVVHSSVARDMPWLLSSLRPSSSSLVRAEAAKILKKLIKSADETFWEQNCAQIVSVLLEAFLPENAMAVEEVDSRSNRSGKMPLTGLSPPSFTLTKHEMTSNFPTMKNNFMKEAEKENELNSEGMTGFENSNSNTFVHYNMNTIKAEAMHIACKALLLLLKIRGKNLLGLVELLVSKLCSAAAFAPVAILIHSEQILSGVSVLDPLRTIRCVTPFLSSSNEGSVPTQLLALHTVTASIKCITSPMLLVTLPDIVSAALPLLESNVVDVRKSVIFVLVEAYMVVGDALLPFVSGLIPAQRKLLTIYIERQLNQRRHEVDPSRK